MTERGNPTKCSVRCHYGKTRIKITCLVVHIIISKYFQLCQALFFFFTSGWINCKPAVTPDMNFILASVIVLVIARITKETNRTAEKKPRKGAYYSDRVLGRQPKLNIPVNQAARRHCITN